MTARPLYYVEVEAGELHVRPGPSEDAAPIGTVAAGTYLAVTGPASGGWLPVASGDAAGWVAASGVARAPRLVVDVFADTHFPHGDARDWAGLVADVRYVGAILKATEAWPTQASWSRRDTAWFTARWDQVRVAAGARYGATFFRGAYHYLIFDPRHVRDQVDFYLSTVERAGGWQAGDLIPIVDVERGGEKSPNHHADAATVEDVTSGFVAAVRAATGQKVMIYGRGAMRDLGITSRMGADYLWNPAYTATLPSAEREGWPLAQVALWQYTNGTNNSTRFPTHAPVLGAVDCSVSLAADLPALVSTIVRSSTN